ncbi:MAG: glucose-1-phosphate adenylyltransferase [Rhodothermia bacterium]
MISDVLTIILGGGSGTRLFPLTRLRSKPAVPLAGKYRLIDIPISNSINSGMSRIMVLTQFNSASLNWHVSRAYVFDRFSSGFVTILAAEQTHASSDWFQGTADAVRKVLPHIRARSHAHALILSGDQLYRMDYRLMLQHHIDQNADVTIATIPVTAEEAPGLGILKTNDVSDVVEFVEKPSSDNLAGLESKVSDQMQRQDRIYLGSMGIYIFNQDVLDHELSSRPDVKDFGKELIPDAIDRRRVVSYPFEGYWSDIGTIRSFYEANLDLAGPSPKFDMFEPTAPIYTNPRILPPAKIIDSTIHHSLIAEACVILNSKITDSVIGIRSYIGSDVKISRSIVLGMDYYSWHDRSVRNEGLDGPDNPGIGKGSVIENTIMDRNVRIGDGCVIRNHAHVDHADGDNYYIRDGIVVLPKNAVLPAGTVI